MAFSDKEVVGLACQSRSWFVLYSPRERTKQTEGRTTVGVGTTPHPPPPPPPLLVRPRHFIALKLPFKKDR